MHNPFSGSTAQTSETSRSRLKSQSQIRTYILLLLLTERHEECARLALITRTSKRLDIFNGRISYEFIEVKLSGRARLRQIMQPPPPPQRSLLIYGSETAA